MCVHINIFGSNGVIIFLHILFILVSGNYRCSDVIALSVKRYVIDCIVEEGKDCGLCLVEE